MVASGPCPRPRAVSSAAREWSIISVQAQPVLVNRRKPGLPNTEGRNAHYGRRLSPPIQANLLPYSADYVEWSNDSRSQFPAPRSERRDLPVEASKPAREGALITSSWSRRGSRSRCPSRSLVWAGGRFSPCRYFLLRKRTNRRHRTRAPKRPLRAASRAAPEPLPFEDRLAANRSRHLPRWRATALRRSR